MNGDTELLCPKTINTLINSKITTIGVNHQAFLTFRKLHTSPNIDLLFDILPPIYYILPPLNVYLFRSKQYC